MRSLARPGAPMREPESKTSSPHTPSVGRKRPGVGTPDDAQAAVGGSAAGRLGTTAESGAKTDAQKPLQPAWAVGLREIVDDDTGEI